MQSRTSINEPSSTIVLNMDRVSKDKVLSRNSSTNNMSFATDKPHVSNVDDLSLELSGIQEDVAHGMDATDIDEDDLSEESEVVTSVANLGFVMVQDGVVDQVDARDDDVNDEQCKGGVSRKSSVSPTDETSAAVVEKDASGDDIVISHCSEQTKEDERREVEKELKYGIFSPLAEPLEKAQSKVTEIYGIVLARVEKMC